MKKASRTLSARIHKINGQLQAVEKMIVQKRSCVDVLQQIGAVRSGIENVASLVFLRELERLAAKRRLSQTDVEKITSIYSKIM